MSSFHYKNDCKHLQNTMYYQINIKMNKLIRKHTWNLSRHLNLCLIVLIIGRSDNLSLVYRQPKMFRRNKHVFDDVIYKHGLILCIPMQRNSFQKCFVLYTGTASFNHGYASRAYCLCSEIQNIQKRNLLFSESNIEFVLRTAEKETPVFGECLVLYYYLV